jgi:hypothetical protein
MALADIVLEGLILILVIALGAVLIGGLSYLTTTTASANNARLMTAGTYVYLAGPTYINGTLYVPMYNIGEYTVEVKYLFVEGLNGVQEYATNIILKPGQYYVYELSIDYTPEAVTIVVSPINDPRLALEFSSNVSTPKPIALTPISQATFGNCPVTVIVNDPYKATWQVTWSSQSGLSGSRVGSSTDRWCVIPNSPGVINFQASVTNNPNLYTCWVNPQQTWVNYTGAPVGAVFNVECAAEFVYVNVNDPYNAGWNVSSISTIYINPKIQEGSVYATITGSSSVSNQILPIPLQCTSSGCSAAAELTASITSNPTNPPYTCSINPSYVGSVTPGGTYNFAVSCTPLFIYVNVLNDTLNAGWEVESVQNWNCNLYSCSPVPYATISGDTDVNNEILPAPPPPTLNELSPNVVAQIISNPIGYVCTINPGSLTANYGGTYSFTVDCNVAPIKVEVEYTPGTINAGWSISWSGAATGSETNNSPTTFNVYPGENATVYFTAKITSKPSNYKSCTITPTNTTAYPGQTVTFTVDCTPKYFVYVTVTGDQDVTSGPAVWSVSSSVYTLTYDWNVANWTLPIGGPTDTLYAQILSCPSHYTCSINPNSIQVTNGSYVTFQISMQWEGGSGSNNYVYITVTGDTCGAEWQITSSSGSSLTGTGNVNNKSLSIGEYTGVILDAGILSGNATISPTSTSAVAGGSYTFTVTCQGQGQPPPPPPPSKYYCIVTPSASDNVGGESGAYVSPQGTQYIPPGQSVTFTWNVQNNPVWYGGVSYYLMYWVVELNGQIVQNSTVIGKTTTSAYYTFQCPSNLNSNQTYTLAGKAHYEARYLEVGGGSTFNVQGSGNYSITHQYTTAYFYWNDPLLLHGIWEVYGSAYGFYFDIKVILYDSYSISSELTAKTRLSIQGPAGYICYLSENVNEQGVIPGTQTSASDWLPTSATIPITCVQQSGKGQ